MGRIIFITSFKGGVGKTTLTANLATALTVLGKRVLVVDADYGNRCMDLVLGMENSSLFDSSDVISGRVNAQSAIAQHESNGRLSFLAAPAAFSSELSVNGVVQLLAELKPQYDFVLVDSSAEDSRVYRAFARSADDALVVSFHQSTAIRAAEKTATVLSSLGFSNIRLVVNSYHKEAEEAGALPSVFDIIQRAHIRLLGVIPCDYGVALMQEKGALAFSGNGRLCPFEAATLNIAKRLLGEPIPLLKDVYKPQRLQKHL